MLKGEMSFRAKVMEPFDEDCFVSIKATTQTMINILLISLHHTLHDASVETLEKNVI
jgi:hypothetical protein